MTDIITKTCPVCFFQSLTLDFCGRCNHDLTKRATIQDKAKWEAHLKREQDEAERVKRAQAVPEKRKRRTRDQINQDLLKQRTEKKENESMVKKAKKKAVAKKKVTSRLTPGKVKDGIRDKGVGKGGGRKGKIVLLKKPISQILRWMGANGYSVNDGVKLVESQKLPAAFKTIQSQIKAAQSGSFCYGPLKPFTKKEEQDLKALITKATGSKSKSKPKPKKDTRKKIAKKK
jgi:hypothetical protein